MSVGDRLPAAADVAVEAEARLEHDLGRGLELALGHHHLGRSAARPADEVAGTGAEVDGPGGHSRELERAVGPGAGGGEELVRTACADVHSARSDSGRPVTIPLRFAPTPRERVTSRPGSLAWTTTSTEELDCSEAMP